jgi:hypothetical protein
MIENMLGSLTKVRILRLFFEYPNMHACRNARAVIKILFWRVNLVK